jgi:hypothetical protein
MICLYYQPSCLPPLGGAAPALLPRPRGLFVLQWHVSHNRAELSASPDEGHRGGVVAALEVQWPLRNMGRGSVKSLRGQDLALHDGEGAFVGQRRRIST